MRKLFIGFVVCFIAIIIPYFVFAADVTLQWDANIEHDLAGYKIYYDVDSGEPYSNVIDVGNVTEHTINGLDNSRSYYFVLTAYNNKEPVQESGFSDEVFLKYSANNPPSKPNLLKVFWETIIGLFGSLKVNWS